jgi:tryptophan halogenase
VTIPVNHVVIVGRDAAAWLAAVSLRRALGGTGLAVTVVELPSALTAADVYTATPALDGLHSLLGLSEGDVLRVCHGVPVLAQRYSGWSGDGSAFVHGHDVKRPAIDDTDFLQFWVKARGQGMRVPWEDFSIAAAAAKQARLTSQGGDRMAHHTVVPGYHLHARAYAGAMRQLALSNGVRHLTSRSTAVEREGDRIAALLLDDGTRVEGELYIDASGVDAVLTSDRALDDWGRWFPCDRTVILSGPALWPLPGFSEIAAFPDGWIGMFPLQDRTAVIGTYRSDGIADADMVEAIVQFTKMRFAGAPVFRPLQLGARLPWAGNCVAIGDAAGTLETLDAVQLLVAHVGISNLIEMFPVDGGAMPEAGVYNATIRRYVTNIRDFQIAHYRLNARIGEPLWDGARDTEPPDTLAAKLALFAARGCVPTYDDEMFLEQNWAAILIGHGLIPRDYDAHVDTVPASEQREKFQALLHLIAQQVRAMPDIATYLAGGQAPAPAMVRGL